MNRRNLLITTGITGLTLLGGKQFLFASDKDIVSNSGGSNDMPASEPTHDAPWREFAPSGMSFPDPNDPLVLSDEEWQERLSELAYRVLRKEATERPHTSSFYTSKAIGLYACAGCDLPLFTSAMKYNSGTGWPSFFTSIDGHLETKRDYKLWTPRTEYHCIRCKGHQGHLFNDGPKPTGERWCNNGVALKFIAKV